MKTFFCILSFIVMSISINAQKSSAYPIEVSKKTISIPTLYEGKPIRSYKLIELIANDEIAFFDLKNKYNTPLKVKNFKASTEYTDSIHPNFIEMRNSVMQNEYCYSLPLDDAQYNLQTKRFNFRFRGERFYTTTLKGYIGIGQYINLSCPSLKEQDEGLSIGSYDVFLKSPIVSEELASEIEDGKYRLLFIFKFDKVKSEKRDVYGGTSGDAVFTHDFILCKTSKLYLYNPLTESIVADWSSLLSVPTQQRKTIPRKKK